jgi:hypothetical protein
MKIKKNGVTFLGVSIAISQKNIGEKVRFLYQRQKSEIKDETLKNEVMFSGFNCHKPENYSIKRQICCIWFQLSISSQKRFKDKLKFCIFF